RARAAPRPALACETAPRAPARPPSLSRRACPFGRDDRLLGLHAQPGRMRGGRRCERPARRAAWGGMAAVRAPVAPGVPPNPPARARHERLLHRPPDRGLTRPVASKATRPVPGTGRVLQGHRLCRHLGPEAGLPNALSPQAMSGAWHRTWLCGTVRRRGRTILAMAWKHWIRTVEIEPSLYAADFARLG